MSCERPVSARQIKAARALLDWSQEELAHAAKLSIATVRKLELGHISPRLQTTRLIHQAVEYAGLEFLDSEGVRRRLEDVSVFRGVTGADDFFEDIQETMRQTDGWVGITASSLAEFKSICGTGEGQRLDAMLRQNPNLSVKCLLMDVSEQQISTPKLEFRVISKSYANTVSFYVYGDKYALIPTDNDVWPKITAVRSASVAEGFRRQFFSLWEKATPGYSVIRQESVFADTRKKIAR